MPFNFPNAPVDGGLFQPGPGMPTYAWDATAGVWKLTSGGLSAGVYIGDSPPANPVPGQLFWESDSGNTFILYNDGNSSQWVQFNMGLLPDVPSVVKVTTFLVNGTYVPDPKMMFMEATAWGGGGGGSGAAVTAAAQITIGSGGNAGAKAYLRADKATIGGASRAVTIGAGGAGGNGAAGGVGGDTSLGSLLSAKGGEGGSHFGPNSTGYVNPPNASQSAVGTIRGWTVLGTSGAHVSGSFLVLPISGQNELGGGQIAAIQANGTSSPSNTGAGGGSATNGTSQAAARVGGNGGSGFLYITEYCMP